MSANDLKIFWWIYTSPFRKRDWYRDAAKECSECSERRLNIIGACAVIATIISGAGLCVIGIGAMLGFVPWFVHVPLFPISCWMIWRLRRPTSKN